MYPPPVHRLVKHHYEPKDPYRSGRWLVDKPNFFASGALKSEHHLWKKIPNNQGGGCWTSLVGGQGGGGTKINKNAIEIENKEEIHNLNKNVNGLEHILMTTKKVILLLFTQILMCANVTKINTKISI